MKKQKAACRKPEAHFESKVEQCSLPELFDKLSIQLERSIAELQHLATLCDHCPDKPLKELHKGQLRSEAA